MKIVELILDEQELGGIDAISLVEKPAIEENFVALKEQELVQFAKIDEEKRLLVGLFLKANKPIYRKNADGEEYYIYFSRETVRKASQHYLKMGNQANSNVEHSDQAIEGVTLVESWIVEDIAKDKTAIYGLNAQIGDWAGALKIDNEDIWQNYVKTGKVKGFSIEGFFSDKMDRPKDNVGMSKELSDEEILIEKIKEIIKDGE